MSGNWSSCHTLSLAYSETYSQSTPAILFTLAIGGSEVTSVAYDTEISGGDWDGWKFTSVDGTLKFAKITA